MQLEMQPLENCITQMSLSLKQLWIFLVIKGLLSLEQPNPNKNKTKKLSKLKMIISTLISPYTLADQVIWEISVENLWRRLGKCTVGLCEGSPEEF